MDAIDLVPLLEALDEDIDGLEEALVPLTKGTLVDAASRLPLLDKAQLFVLVTYAIETILFSYLRLNGINAKEHDVFLELTRVKQYFEKIKDIENAGSRRENLSLDKAAAGRIIKHALSGNAQQGLKRKGQQAASSQIQDRSAETSNGSVVADHHQLNNHQTRDVQDDCPRRKRQKPNKEKPSSPG